MLAGGTALQDLVLLGGKPGVGKTIAMINGSEVLPVLIRLANKAKLHPADIKVKYLSAAKLTKTFREKLADAVFESRHFTSPLVQGGGGRLVFGHQEVVKNLGFIGTSPLITSKAMIEKEPVTVVLSQKGWIRAMRGHLDDTSGLQFKEDDTLKRARKASTTDTLVLFATNGKFYSLGADKLPGGRGHGEPVRLMIEMEENHDIVEMFVHQPGRKLLVASSAGYGFIVNEDDVVVLFQGGSRGRPIRSP